jgi:hypothetical protein
MADLSVLIGTIGALAGVGLGSWLAARSQRDLLRDSHLLASISSREASYGEFLAVSRQFRRFLMTQPTKVRIIERANDQRSTPVIDGSKDYWEALDAAFSKLAILAGDRAPHRAASEVLDSIYEIASARAIYTEGEVPDEIIMLGRTAENRFAKAARDDLIESRTPAPRVRSSWVKAARRSHV